MPPKYIPTLDGWRAIAIGMVIMSHAIVYGLNGPPSRWLGFGPFGVSIFFAISGYLITTRFVSHNPRSLREFYWRRAFRILPPALTYLAFLTFLSIQGPRLGFLSSLFFFSNYVPIDQRGWNVAHFWSLSMEEQFYLIWPAIIVLLGIRRASRVALATVPVLSLWRAWAISHTALSGVMASQRTDFRLDAFAVPCFLAILLQDAHTQKRIRGWLSPILFCACAALSIACCLGPKTIIYLGTALLLPLVVLSTVLHPEWLFSQFLEWPAVRWIGRISYSLYLWQEVILGYTHWRIWFQLIALLAASATSYYLVETPMIALGRKAFRYLERNKLSIIDLPSVLLARIGDRIFPAPEGEFSLLPGRTRPIRK
jgi:peptidoglycan/LPS O-acetylase OafA/YrhL